MRRLRDALEHAVADGIALAAINVPGFEAMVGVGKAAAAADQPVIIQTSARLVSRHGAPTLRRWFEAASLISGADCYLHLDHCHDEAILRDCIDNRWDMVMFDGSSLPIGENVRRSRLLTDYAHTNGVGVEGEVGAVGGEEDGHEALANVASLDEVERLARDGGIDCIAVGFGNIHGDYRSTSHLRWDVYEQAYDRARLPLVLHGGSGLSDEEFRRAIKAGTAKINISTELKKAYVQAITDSEVVAAARKNPSIIHDRLEQAAFDVASHNILLFSSRREQVPT